MKNAISLTPSFLLFVFITNLSLPFSTVGVGVVSELYGDAVLPGLPYHILPVEGGGGLSLVNVGDSNCSVTVLQDYKKELIRGSPVKFTTKESHLIYTDSRLEIEFINKSSCAESAKWLSFIDKSIHKTCIGIGGPKNYPGRTLDGIFTFNIEALKSGVGYKLRYCYQGNLYSCRDVGRYDNHEDGKRLCLTKESINDDDAFQVVFLRADPDEDYPPEEDGIIKSAV